MNARKMTKDELIAQLAELRTKTAELERMQAGWAKERKELQESSSMLQSLLHNSPEPMVVYDAEGAILFLNDAFTTAFGWSYQELKGRRIDYVPEDSLAQTQETLERIFKGEHVPPYDTRRLTKDGRILDVHISSALFTNSLGKPIGHIVTLRDITERKRMEQTLRQSEKRYRELVENANDIIFQSDSRGITTLVNLRALKITGYSKEEFIGKHYLDFVHPEYRAQAERFYGIQFVKKLPTSYYEMPVLTKQQETIWLGQNVQLMIEDDAVVGFQAIARDITERKLAQQALGESERRFREVLEKVDLLAATIDAEGRIIFCNDFLLALTGRQGEEVLGKNWFHIFVGEEQREAQVKAHREFMSQGEIPLHRENEIVKRDGSALLIRWTNTLLHDLYGKVIGATGIGEDITEKRQAEDSLRESEEKYRKILETIVDGYHESDLEGNLTLVNDSLCRIGGYSREELVGVNYRLLMDSHDAKLVSSAYNDVYRTGKANPGIGFQIIRKDGEKRHVVVSVAPARDKGGNPCGFRGIFRDVTDQIQLQRQLLQAQKMEAIGTLAGGIAHDFNNLLMIILGYSDMLLHGRNPGDKAYDALRHIRQAATEGGDLVKRILAFSRKIEPEFRLMDLNQEIRRIHNLLNRTIPKMIETELILDQDLRTVKADPVLLEHVVLNLAVNAQHAMPEGGRLVIETQNVTLREDYCRNHLEVKPGKYVMLSVSDTGEGIEKDIQDRIFDPFFTTKEEEGGTGLGLSMVHGIVTLHGGHVRCYSEPRLGTIFKVYLPVVPGEVLSGVDTTMEMPAFGSETILLVDDETRVREIAADLLAMAGYTVLTAGNGLEALEVYQQNRGEISLVILDLIMPKMGGKQCLEELLKIDPDVKVLVATGYSANGPTKAIVEAGAKASIIKPFDMKMLLKAVRDALDEI